MKKSYKGFPIYALIIIGVLIAAQLFSSSFSSQRGQRIEAAKLFEYIDSGVIDAVALEDDVAYAHMKASNIPLSAFSNSAYDFSAIISRDTFVETCRQLAARKAGTTADDVTEIDLGFDLSYLPQPATPWLLEMLPYIIMTVGLMAFWMMMMRQQGGGGGKMMTFGHSPARVFEPDGNRVTFADVAGAVEEKEEMQELVEFPQKSAQIYGGRRAHSQGRAAGRPARHRQNAAGEGRRGRGKRRRLCPFPVRTLWKCLSAWAQAACATCLIRRRSMRRASFLSMKSTRWAVRRGAGHGRRSRRARADAQPAAR